MKFDDFWGRLWRCFARLWDALEALAGLGSGRKSMVFVMDYQGGSRIQSTPKVEGEASVWEA